MKKRHLVLLASITLMAAGANQPAMADSTAETPESPATDTSEVGPLSEESFIKSADAKWSKFIVDGQEMLKNGKETPAVSMFKRSITQLQRTSSDNQAAKDRMTAISNKKLGMAYTQSGDYLKADAQFQLAKAACDKASIKDDDLARAMDDLAQHYKTIDPNTLGDSVTGYLKEACVNKIAVFRQPDKDLVEINLDQKFIKPIDSKDVPKVSFNKKVSFEFFNLPNGDYKVQKIQGLQVFAKSLWVNLFESLLRAGEKPVAEVTAGKMGVTKTVTVDVPNDMYSSTKKILDNLIGAIKGQPAYAATSGGTNLSEPEISGNSTSNESSSNSGSLAAPSDFPIPSVPSEQSPSSAPVSE